MPTEEDNLLKMNSFLYCARVCVWVRVSMAESSHDQKNHHTSQWMSVPPPIDQAEWLITCCLHCNMKEKVKYSPDLTFLTNTDWTHGTERATLCVVDCRSSPRQKQRTGSDRQDVFCCDCGEGLTTWLEGEVQYDHRSLMSTVEFYSFLYSSYKLSEAQIHWKFSNQSLV